VAWPYLFPASTAGNDEFSLTFRDAYSQKTLSGANMFVYLGGVRNDTGAFVLRYNGALNGVIDSYLAPVAGSTYTFTKVFCWYWGSDTGLLSTGGVFNDRKTRTYNLCGIELTNLLTTANVVDCYTYRTIATTKATFTDINNTIDTLAANHPCESLPVTPVGGQDLHASNLTIEILPSQAPANIDMGFKPYHDAVNNTDVAVFIGFTSNVTTTILSTHLKVTIGDDDTALVALTSVGTALTCYYKLPSTLTQSAVTIHARWTAISNAAAAVTAISATTVFYATAAAPQTALMTL